MYLRVTNNYGQLVEQITTSTNQIVSFGEKLKAGIYFLEVTQGETRKQVKPAKQ